MRLLNPAYQGKDDCSSIICAKLSPPQSLKKGMRTAEMNITLSRKQNA